MVFSRGIGWGHVGFYLDETENEIKVLGGNQENKETRTCKVSEKHYPKTRLLGYRIPGYNLVSFLKHPLVQRTIPFHQLLFLKPQGYFTFPIFS